jgi:chromosome segregation ATPase
VQRLFEETKSRCQALEAGMSELKSKVEKMQEDYDRKLANKEKIIQRQISAISLLREREKQSLKLGTSGQTVAENKETNSSATMSLSSDDDRSVEKSHTGCTQKDGGRDLSEENKELRAELQKYHRRMKELEDVKKCYKIGLNLCYMETFFL